MTDHINRKHVRKSMRASFNTIKRQSALLSDLCNALDPDNMAGVEVADFRDTVELLTQVTHEFSAYWNVYHTHRSEADD
jgi:hypothetical protein